MEGRPKSVAVKVEQAEPAVLGAPQRKRRCDKALWRRRGR